MKKPVNQSIRCFDIGGSKIVAADVTDSGSITEIGRMATPAEDYSQFCQALSSLCPQDNTAISIAMAGNINPASGVVQCANLPCVSGRNLATDLTNTLGREVHLINDAKAFALAESRFGKAQSHAIVLAIILGTGVGGAVVINDQLLIGADGTAGEWGHGPASTMRTGHRLPEVDCNCGQSGCIDALGGARGLERIYTHMGAAESDSVTILNAWQADDAVASRAVDVWLDLVGGALANVINFLGPSVVAVGGGLANNTALIEALEVEVNHRRLVAQQSAVLYPAVSGPEQGLLGASMYARSD